MAISIGIVIGEFVGLGAVAYLDSKDGKMLNGDIKWYDYLGAVALGGLIGAGISFLQQPHLLLVYQYLALLIQAAFYHLELLKVLL